ncbi:MAG: cell wall hydrolase [Oscillospiraceae bacterium]|nr:cell wall hydrolase [Oscillospiraceae bacterium]
MRKAKVVAIVCGMIVSCLIGGFAVVEAATVKLDDSSTEYVDYADYYEPTSVSTETATTVTSIETTAKTTKITATTENTEDTSETAEDTTEATTSVTTETTETTEATTTTTETEAPAPTTEAETAAEIVTTEAAATAAAPQSVAPATTPAPAAAPTDTETEMTNPPMPVETCAVLTAPPVVETEAPVTEPVAAVSYGSSITVSESDYILLCNAVAHEAGANNISVTEKAKVVEVIMNRVNSSSFPNSIYGVLTQKYQFSGSSTYVNLGTYSNKVTSMVKEAVDLYLSDPSQFSEGYLYFTGDGKQNHFR